MTVKIDPVLLMHQRDVLTDIAHNKDLTQDEIDILDGVVKLLESIMGSLRQSPMPSREEVEEFVANFAPRDPDEFPDN